MLKGRNTVVCDGAHVYVNDTGNAGMATAGAGDVLAGILGAYLAPCGTGASPDWTPLDRTIDNQVARLRKKIERDPSEPKLIKTVRGIGYRFDG